MDKTPTLYKLGHLIRLAKYGPKAGINGSWVPSRPLGYYSLKARISIAWQVFKGNADAVVWPEDEPTALPHQYESIERQPPTGE